MSVTSNLNNIKSSLPDEVKLVAVSKFHPVQSVMEAYNAGQRIFGESRMQEVNVKQAQLPEDIEWHFIGHLQTNKVKAIIPYIHTIQSVDSWRLLSEIGKQASAVNRHVNCLLEIHIAEEESKFGLTLDTCSEMLEQNNWQALTHVHITGVMGMATYTDDFNRVRDEFKKLKFIFNELKNRYFSKNEYFSEISMGMSHDYPIAIEEGSTMVRVGSAIFGER
ncbi:YggS family pyridoxal phosphate-dependent enzyme [Dysgonomonas sp. 216]|uniref:YggS family pyridoxal phosphate-dependent enzyme n=1 Tax=Dysgonomonas sp. 216 TaxID=2302934 RepID=UPI0013D2CC30|nr:YggS family pyridoxal phosphate-dependent enzyme [Dysgonomonas sp. 216]NDW19471.1 YggS family pyridoxal phosphate-dependent enzyme [Dysgonomonas sp. 216]